MCNNLWEHLSDPMLLLSRIKQIIKPGGHLILSTPNRYRLRNLGRILSGKPVIFMSPHHVTEYTIGQVQEQLAYGGFETRRVLSSTIWTGSLKTKVAQWVFSRLISLTGSHHQLGATAFYLGRRRPPVLVSRLSPSDRPITAVIFTARELARASRSAHRRN